MGRPECNIDAHGRVVRLVWGIVTLLAGLTVCGLMAMGGLTSDWWWVVAGVLAAFGVLGIYEARAGWCVVRAMGFKTRI